VVARHLHPAQPLVVVTNDVGIMNELAARESVQLVFLGGTLRRKNLSFCGTQTERARGPARRQVVSGGGRR
jgi:DeoR family transcriptional regulator of aga operon